MDKLFKQYFSASQSLTHMKFTRVVNNLFAKPKKDKINVYDT